MRQPSIGRRQPSKRQAFTLIEILIVVIILGILAAIVIPQFASASSDARRSSIMSTVHTMKSEVALYRLQHNDILPGGTLSGSVYNGAFSSDQFWTHMTSKTDANGAAFVQATSATGPFGPYMQDIPKNALNASTTVVDGAASSGQLAAAAGYQYDYSAGSGKVWGTDTDGKTIIP